MYLEGLSGRGTGMVGRRWIARAAEAANVEALTKKSLEERLNFIPVDPKAIAAQKAFETARESGGRGAMQSARLHEKQTSMAQIRLLINTAKTPQERLALTEKYLPGTAEHSDAINAETARQISAAENDSAGFVAAIKRYNAGQDGYPYALVMKRLNSYFGQGQASPGRLTLQLAQSAFRQWRIDAAPSKFDKALQKAVPVVGAAMGAYILAPVFASAFSASGMTANSTVGAKSAATAAQTATTATGASIVPSISNISTIKSVVSGAMALDKLRKDETQTATVEEDARVQEQIAATEKRIAELNAQAAGGIVDAQPVVHNAQASVDMKSVILPLVMAALTAVIFKG